MSGKWRNEDAGPRQVKDFSRALGKLRGEGKAQDELYGVIGGKESRSTTIGMCEAMRLEVAALDEAIGERYGWTVTRATVRAIIADYEAALPEARTSRPVVDNRRSPEEEAERTAAADARAAEYRAAQEAQEAILGQAMAKAPAGAQALIIAELHQDESDAMTDYFNSRVLRTVAIGFRTGSREDFRQLRAAAAAFPETAHMASEETLAAWHDANGNRRHHQDHLEHRDNWSMGGGNYLSDHDSANYGTGWVVRSRPLPCSHVSLTEDAVPEKPAAAAPSAASVMTSGAVTVSPSSLGKDGVVEIRFAAKPAPEVLADLKAHGFRWARGNQCWYGRDVAYAEALAGTPEDVQHDAGPEPQPAQASEPAPRPQRATTIAPEVLAVLASAETDGNAVKITARLDRNAYVQVNKILEAAGGKWNRGAKAHLFPSDAAPVLAALMADGSVVTAQDEGYFPTPAAVVADLLDLADLEPGMEVLEPSAGDGAIAGPAAARGCAVDCVELNAKRADGLRSAGFARTVTAGDFLEVPQRPAYDRVLMNPPFAGKADAAHVRHALGFLRPGGLLMAVMSAGVTFREDRGTAGFRDLVDEAGGVILPLPDDAFKESGTGVRTVLVTIPATAGILAAVS